MSDKLCGINSRGEYTQSQKYFRQSQSQSYIRMKIRTNLWFDIFSLNVVKYISYTNRMQCMIDKTSILLYKHQALVSFIPS